MSETRYAQVARDLVAAISSGRFPVGSLLPTEFELCDQYGASRNTIRTALRELQDLGFVSRKKKAGTRVEAAAPSIGFRQSLASVEDLVQFGQTHTRDVQEVAEIVMDRTTAKETGCLPGTHWLRISSLRLDGNPNAPPIGWTDVYIDPAYAELGDVVRRSPSVLISSLIESRYGRRIAQIQQDVKASLLPERLAKPLKARAGAPALKIVRRYIDQAGSAFKLTVSTHPADRFKFSVRLNREKASVEE